MIMTKEQLLEEKKKIVESLSQLEKAFYQLKGQELLIDKWLKEEETKV
jgi:hypothetical protein